MLSEAEKPTSEVKIRTLQKAKSAAPAETWRDHPVYVLD
jgi:hypothetical protein